MTPIWRRIAKHVAASYREDARRDAVRDLIAVERAFDMTPVLEMVNEVAAGLIEQINEDGDHTFDLGERCVMPFDSFWVEFESYGGLLNRQAGTEGRWALTNMTTDEMGSRLTCNRMGALVETQPGQYQHEETDGSRHDVRSYIAQVNRIAVDDPEVSASARHSQRVFASQLLAAVAIINSPRAKQVDGGTSKLLASRLVLNGKRPEARWTKIHIVIGDGTVGSAPGLTTSPKAYHFVRAHNRTLATGIVSRVRAHWRGDPAFGIRIGVYDVRATAA